MAARSAVRSSFLHALSTSVLAGGGIAAAQAQSVALPTLVVSASQFPIEAAKVGASVTALSGEELRAKGIETLADALRTVPGVAVSQSGTRGSLTEVRLRGGETNQVLVLIDGIEVNGLADSEFNFADFPLDDIERIEVVRGPQSGLYGSNANTGVISIVTRSGKGLSRPAAEAKVEGGSMRTAGGAANVRGALGPLYGSVTVSDYFSRGFNISRFGTEPDGNRALTFTAKGGVDVTPYLNVEGVLRTTKRSADGDPQDFTFGAPTFGLVTDGNARTTYENFAGRVGATLTLFDGRWIQSANYKGFKEDTRGFNDDFLTFGAVGTRNAVDYKSTFLFDTSVAGGERHTVSALVDDKWENYSQVLVGQAPYMKERKGYAGEYVLDLASLTTLSGALRRDINSAFVDVTTWRLAIAQRIPATGTRLHASQGKGVTDPSVFELFGSPFNLPNPSLLPEQSIGWDAGIEQAFFGDRFVADVTYFSSDFTNKIELDFDPALGNFIYRNGVGTATRRGVEVSGRLRVFDWLATTASYTYTDAHNSVGNQEVRRPPHSAAIEATARFLDNKARLTVGVNYNGSRQDFVFTPTGTVQGTLPGATVVRGQFSYDATPYATWFVRAENLFNAQYEEVFSYRMPGFAVYGGVKLRTPAEAVVAANN
jgi:vitamin B12 transporter